MFEAYDPTALCGIWDHNLGNHSQRLHEDVWCILGPYRVLKRLDRGVYVSTIQLHKPWCILVAATTSTPITITVRRHVYSNYPHHDAISSIYVYIYIYIVKIHTIHEAFGIEATTVLGGPGWL